MTQSLGELLRTATGKLQSAGIQDARIDAKLLARHIFDYTSAHLITHEDLPAPGGEVQNKFLEAIARRAKREPLQHIIGTVEFFGLELLCDDRALIPRADSETVVEAALQTVPDSFNGTVVDLGTGSGCLLLACLSKWPNARGIGLDQSYDALSLAQENARHTGLQDRCSFLGARWESWDGWQTADIVISNPPYIESGIIASLEKEVRGYDPMSALDGGHDGLSAYRSIFTNGENMSPNATLVLEIGFDQADNVPKLAHQHGFRLESLKRDLGGNPRALTLRKGIRK